MTANKEHPVHLRIESPWFLPALGCIFGVCLARPSLAANENSVARVRTLEGTTPVPIVAVDISE